MTVLITLTTAGSDTGPFNLYSNVDGYTTAFETGVSKAALIAGYTSILAPTYTTDVLVESVGVCNRDLYLTVQGAPTTTTSSTSSTSSTTSTSTSSYPEFVLAEKANYASAGGCSLGTIVNIFLSASDYTLFVANGYSFAGLGGEGPTNCTAIARNASGGTITAYILDNDSISWKLTGGNFNYNEEQC